MKQFAIGSAIIVAIVMLCALGTYSGMVSKDEAVQEAVGNVDNVYQRRLDLVPNLVAAVRGMMQHEEQVFTEVTQARAQAQGLTLNVEVTGDMSPEDVAVLRQQFIDAQSQLSGALSRLIAVAEAYPELRSSQQVSDLMSQLEGTENRIAVERRKYNGEARSYNTARRGPINQLFIGMLGWDFEDRYPYFEADAGARTAPTVDLSH